MPFDRGRSERWAIRLAGRRGRVRSDQSYAYRHVGLASRSSMPVGLSSRDESSVTALPRNLVLSQRAANSKTGRTTVEAQACRCIRHAQRLHSTQKKGPARRPTPKSFNSLLSRVRHAQPAPEVAAAAAAAAAADRCPLPRSRCRPGKSASRAARGGGGGGGGGGAASGAEAPNR